MPKEVAVLATASGARAFLSESAWLYILMPFFSIPQGLSMANLSALISKGVSPKRQGAALGINGSLMALSQGLIPLLAGFGSGLFGLHLPFIAGSILIFAAWANLFVPRKR
jgi:MFS family permease